jgi:hypothetical protein
VVEEREAGGLSQAHGPERRGGEARAARRVAPGRRRRAPVERSEDRPPTGGGSKSEPLPLPGPCWVGRAFLSDPELGQVVLGQRDAVCPLRQGPRRSRRCQRETAHPCFEGGPMTQGAERLPRLGLCRAELRSGRPRTARGGVRDPFLRLLLA